MRVAAQREICALAIRKAGKRLLHIKDQQVR
jgi:hypothetical protein